MRLYRLRLQLDDSPGRLGHAAAALGAMGVNILDVEVHGLDGDRRADEFLVDLTVPLDLPAIEQALRNVDCVVTAVRQADPHELVDSSTRCLEVARALVGARPVSDARVGELARLLVRADLCWVGPVPGIPLSGVAARALERRAPAQSREPVKRLSHGGDLPWSLALPFCTDGRRRVLVLVRRSPRFSFTETARAQALLRLRSVLPHRSGEQVVALGDGGTVGIRPVRRTDSGALARLHRRASRESLYWRYFSPLVELPRHLLDRLVDVDGCTRLAVVAVVGSEVVGVAQAWRNAGAPTAEVAFLVEDAHQRRGIGTALLQRLAADLAALGVGELVARTLPENRALPRLVRRPGWPTSTERADGVVLITAELTAPTDVPARGQARHDDGWRPPGT